MKPQFLLYPALLLMLGSKCKQNDPGPPPADPLATLPPETQSGANTFGCLVNGKAFKNPYSTSVKGDWQSISRLALGSNATLNGQSTTEEITLNILLEGKLQSLQYFSLISSASPFPIFTPGVNQFLSGAASTNNSFCYYSGNYIKKGQIQLVKFDGVARIAAGRFAFTLYEPGGCNTLRVTDGRFDVKF